MSAVVLAAPVVPPVMTATTTATTPAFPLRPAGVVLDDQLRLGVGAVLLALDDVARRRERRRLEQCRFRRVEEVHQRRRVRVAARAGGQVSLVLDRREDRCVI